MNHEYILKNGVKPLNLDGVSNETAVEMLRFMLRLRGLQFAIKDNYHPADEMRCPVHFCIGQEGTPAALSQVIQDEDMLLSHHRSHGYYLAKKGSMEKLLAELHGKSTGSNGGLAGSQELSLTDQHFFSGAIVSGMSGIAVGSAIGQQFNQANGITFTAFGDGATEEGLFWESLNYAAMKKLPVVFICENNYYSTYSPLYKRQQADNIHDRAERFGVSVTAVFGNDVPAVYRAIKEAAENARNGNGPALVESYTYRWFGHVGPENDDYIGYRPQEEIDFWKDNCPVKLLQQLLLKENIINDEWLAQQNQTIDGEIKTGFEFAKNSPFPEISKWAEKNTNLSSPLADKFLADESKHENFDFTQQDTIPEPY